MDVIVGRDEERRRTPLMARRIERVVFASASVRVEKEKQVPLFAKPAARDLPELKLLDDPPEPNGYLKRAAQRYQEKADSR